jgi:hypothetical protein
MLEPWLSFLIATLATHRLSSLFAQDDGPLDLMKKLRDWLERVGKWNSAVQFTSDLVGCIRCNSVWFGTALGLGWAYMHELPIWSGVFAGLAMSSLTIWLDQEIA